MKTSLRVLVLEDSKIWAEMMMKQLEKGEYEIFYDLVSAEAPFVEHVQKGTYDVILADYNLPQWDGEKAYQVLKESGKDIPFIIVSGFVEEEKAVDLLKLGIQDFVLKEHLFRLPLVIKKALEERTLRERERQAWERLGLTQLSFKGVLEQSELAIFGYDRDGTIVFWNERCKEVYGATRDQRVGKNILALGTPEEQKKARGYLEKIFGNGGVVYEDWTAEGADGNRRYFHTAHYGVKEESGTVAIGISVSVDVTEIKKLEGQLVQAQKMEAIGQLAGGIAHDFNNQLTVVIGSLKLAMKELGESHSVWRILREAEKAAAQCAFTVKGLLTLGRKSTELRKSTLDFHAILDDFEKFIRHLLPATIEVSIKKQAERSLIDGDPVQIQQVLMNLVVNARDAMPAGGSLFLETQNVYFDEGYAKKIPGAMPGQFVTISVTDTGSGILPENLPRIFEPFFTTKKAGEGTGLGLSTVYGLVKSHGGWIRVYSEPGRGTTFRVYLPVSLGSAAAAPKEIFANVPGGSETILVADDEEAIRGLVKTILEQKGYHVILAKDGEELDLLYRKECHRVDLLLLDLTMPKFSASEALAEIRSIRPNPCVVISSGYSLSGPAAQDMLARGVVAFIQKPYQPEELALVVRSVLDLKVGSQKAA